MCAENARRHADKPPKCIGEVALIRKAGVERDLGKRILRSREPMGAELHASLADIVPHCAAEASAERTGQMHVVDTGRSCQAFKRMMAAKFVVDLLLNAR